jgi:hypothetical protein
MRTTLVTFGLLCTAIAFVTNAGAATCTITSAHIPVASVELDGNLTNLVGFAVPVEITESTGAIAFDLSTLPASPFSLSGVLSTLVKTDGGTGTIDAGGNMVLPAVTVHFTTAALPGQEIVATADLTSGLAAVTLSGAEYPSEGTPLDFSTGALRVEGQVALFNAPTIGQVTTGFGFGCTLSPIPSRDNLPKAPTLTAHGTGKPGKPGDPGTVVGDALLVKAKIKNGAVPLDPTKDVLVRVGLAGADVVLARVAAGDLTQKGKKFSTSDTDGSKIRIITGRKADGGALADVTGSLTIVQSKKGLAVTLKETGVDLSALAAASGADATVTIGVGGVSVSDAAKVKASTKKVVLK